MSENICVLIEQRGDTLDESSLGLVAEARRLIGQYECEDEVQILCMERGITTPLHALGSYGVKKVLVVRIGRKGIYAPEAFSREATEFIREQRPTCVLGVQDKETVEVCSRVAAALGAPLFTNAVDIRNNREGEFTIIRCISNGYLFEEVKPVGPTIPIVCFLPSVLVPDEGTEREKVHKEIVVEDIWCEERTEVKLEQIIEADPSELDIEEADIIVSAGAGLGKGERFEIIHELARELGGVVGGTRPVIDDGLLPYERQIGQTGKVVSPKLIINCGISGANEYTAGMEKSQLIIAINKDPLARMFRFADLGLVGDVHDIIPILTKRLKKIKEAKT